MIECEPVNARDLFRDRATHKHARPLLTCAWNLFSLAAKTEIPAPRLFFIFFYKLEMWDCVFFFQRINCAVTAELFERRANVSLKVGDFTV